MLLGWKPEHLGGILRILYVQYVQFILYELYDGICPITNFALFIQLHLQLKGPTTYVTVLR